MALTLPLTLKLAHLKHVAFKCGISTSGTKTILSNRLINEITASQHVSKTASKPLRILSIDMGIRNLAYCILDVSSKRKKDELPSIHAWRRLAVSNAPTKSLDSDTPVVKEAFDPSTLSTAAYSLIRNRLLPEHPTHILIERQRFRSMGSKHILEWTIRVNMFESILYAVLGTLKAEGIWNGEIQPITPGKVGPFWVGEDTTEGEGTRKERRSKSTKIRNKGLKMDLVKRWLEGGDMVKLGSKEAESMAKAYKEKWDRLPGGRKGGRVDSEEKMGKLDDLADSLLQGMAWIQWEENKRLALKDGVEALLVDIQLDKKSNVKT